MKKQHIAILSLLVASCSTPSQQQAITVKTDSIQPTLTGGDKDEHGCIGSAGYQWSEIKNDCIRVFELPLQLKSKDSTSIAGVVFANDSSRVELFLTEGKQILEKKDPSNYASTQWTLKKSNEKWVISKSNSEDISYQ
jgi:hypothetical protein